MVLADWFKAHGLTPTMLASEADIERAMQIERPWAIAIFNLGGERLAGPALAVNRAIARERPSTPRVILADTENPDCVVDAVREGVRGYLSTQAELAVVKEALSLLLAGGGAACVPQSALSALAGRAEPTGRAQRTPLLRELTLRQLDVLDCICHGLSNKMIARQLQMRESTVKFHVRQIMHKLGVRNRTEAALTARMMATRETSDDATAVGTSTCNRNTGDG